MFLSTSQLNKANSDNRVSFLTCSCQPLLPPGLFLSTSSYWAGPVHNFSNLICSCPQLLLPGLLLSTTEPLLPWDIFVHNVSFLTYSCLQLILPWDVLVHDVSFLSGLFLSTTSPTWLFLSATSPAWDVLVHQRFLLPELLLSTIYPTRLFLSITSPT